MQFILRCCRPRQQAEETDQQPLSQLPKVKVGKRAATLKVKTTENGIHLTGSGAALANTMVEQDAAYWEVRIAKLGEKAEIGVAYERPKKEDLADALHDGQQGWCVSSGPAGKPFEEGDVIGVAFGQGDIPNLRFFLNGQAIDEATVKHVRGEVYPAVFLDGGTELKWGFEPEQFAQPIPGLRSETT
mmetsp:Transcript_68043/g.142085  ORF Transcript_68043/g.142085 Transcript_68043/m.142085 type:complete len:187 (-) Transcript_68043:121-681(-)